MKIPLILAFSGALLATASRGKADKRALRTEVVIEWVTLYETEGVTPSMFAPGAHNYPTTTVTTLTSFTSISSSCTTSEVTSPSPEVVVVYTRTTPTPVVYAPTPDPRPEAVPESNPAPAPESTTGSTPPAAAVTTQPSENATPTDYQSKVCWHHNVHRFNHSAPSIGWSDRMAGYAATLAATCKFAHDVSIGGGGYGQNLAMYATSDHPEALGDARMVAQAITQFWYNGELYQWPASNYGKDNPDMTKFEGWGHWSQLVWASSQEVGCKSQFCPAGTMYPNMGAWFTVCNYYPPGNMGGAYGKNVFPPLGQSSVYA